MPVRILIIEGIRTDCKEVVNLIMGINAMTLLTDRGYGTKGIIDCAKECSMEVAIPPRRNRKESRNYDKCLYKLYQMAKNTFLYLKRLRGIVTRYAA